MHHTGKSGEQRGTSAHEDHVDVSVLLSNPPGYSPAHGCKFIWRATKDRALVTKKTAYVLQLVQNEEGRLEMVAGGADILGRGEKMEQAISLLETDPNMTQKEAKELGISQKTFYRAKDLLKSVS